MTDQLTQLNASLGQVSQIVAGSPNLANISPGVRQSPILAQLGLQLGNGDILGQLLAAQLQPLFPQTNAPIDSNLGLIPGIITNGAVMGGLALMNGALAGNPIVLGINGMIGGEAISQQGMNQFTEYLQRQSSANDFHQGIQATDSALTQASGVLITGPSI